MDFSAAPPEGGVYFSPMVLALRVRLPLSLFFREMLLHFVMSPTQLGPGSWRVALAYEALCNLVRCPCDLEAFRVIYHIKALSDGVLSFSPRARRLITNILTRDNGWKRIFAVMSDQWQSAV